MNSQEGGGKKTTRQNVHKKQRCELSNFLINWSRVKKKKLHQDLSKLLFMFN